MRHALLGLLAVVLTACTADIPNGVIACERDAECPPSYTCRGGSGSRYCYAAGATPGDACADQAPAQSGEGPTSIALQKGDGDCFWIDSTEVTRAQYQRFLGTNPQPVLAACTEWKVSFATSECEQSALNTGQLIATTPNSPIVCVDWCDAAEYCQWAGRTLCHGTARDGSLNDASQSEWYAACSDNSSTSYPYGNGYERDTCNGGDRTPTGCTSNRGGCSTVESGSLNDCVTPAGVRDLSGNVAEWVDECEQARGRDDQCRVRGGSYASAAQDLRCETAIFRTTRAFADAFTGFRCCDR